MSGIPVSYTHLDVYKRQGVMCHLIKHIQQGQRAGNKHKHVGVMRILDENQNQRHDGQRAYVGRYLKR